MNITLTALTAAVVTACFVTAGAKDATPDFPVEEVTSYATLSTSPIIILPDIGNVVNSHATLSTPPMITLPNSSNVVYSYATLSTSPIIYLDDTIELLDSGFSIILEVPVKTVEVANSITSEAHCEAVLPYYDLQYVDAYFKHPSGTAPYFVYGYYNKTIVFGSKLNINTSNVKDTAISSAELETSYIQSIPHQIEKANTELGNIQTFHKSMRPTHTHDLVSVFTGRDPSNVSPYRISDGNVVEIITDFKSLIPLSITKEFSSPLSIVSTNASLSIMPYKLTNAENVTISEAVIGLYVKHTNVTDVVAGVNTVLETVSIHTVQGISAIAELESTLNNITIVFGKTAIIDPISVSIQSIASTQGFAISPYRGLNSIHSEFGVSLHVEDNQTEVIHGVASSGQSDIHVEHINIIGRTETIHTNFENIKLVYNPGVEPVSNSTVSENSTLFRVGDNKTTTDSIHTLSTDNTTSIQLYKLATAPAQTLSTLFGLHTHTKDSDASSLLSTLSSTGVTSSTVDRAVFKTETLATSYGVLYLVIDSTINNVVHTLITSCVDTLVYNDPIEITDVSETLSTSFGIDMYQIGSYEAVDNLSSDVPNIQLRAKETTPPALNTMLTTHVAQYYVTKPVNYKADTLITAGVVGVAPYKLITMLRDELITEFVVSVQHKANQVESLLHNVSTYLNDVYLANGLRLEIHDAAHTLVTSREAHFSVDRLLQTVSNSSTTSLGSAVLVAGDNKTVPDLLDNLSTSMSIELYKDSIITDVVELSSSENSTTVYIKDATAFPLNNLTSTGQSDIHAEYINVIGRTEQLQTNLGNVALHRDGGITDAVNNLNTDFLMSIAVGELLTTEALNSLSSAYGIQMSPLLVIGNLLNQAQTNLGSVLIVVGEDVSSNNNINSIVSGSAIRFFKDQLLNNALNTVVTNNITNMFVLHGTPTPLNSLASTGQSDIHVEHINVIGRTETIYTNLGNIQLVRTPGVNNALNTLITTNVTTFVTGKNNTADHAHIVESSFGVKTAVDYPADATDGLVSTGIVTLYVKHHSSTSVVTTAVTTNYSTIIVRKSNVSEQLNTTMTALDNAQYSVAHPVTITLAKQGGTGGTNSITTIAGFSITPASITPPTRIHFTFKGYYTLSAGGTQVINSSGTYVALTNSTYMSPITLYAQWTDVVYTITWKNYKNETLKTENLIYGSTSTAPTGTADTTQYDYSWPKASTSVIGNETITETRTTKSYTITWKAYSGATLKSETLLYGATSTAPTGTSDTAQYDYAWPKSSTTVVGAETITETQTTKSYTITWYFYNGEVAKQETRLYGSTSTAPTGTTDTAKYQYDWPKASTTVTGTENINETRTLLSYTVTWYKYGQSGENYAKRETLTYGSTSTAPTGNVDTAQYDYSWPKTSTTVVGTENITETRVILSYTITWKSYTSVTLKSETLTYGSTSTAPIGTSDTTEYDYTWPKSSTTVVAVETITETRTAKSYTLTFEGNGATPSPTTKTVTFGQPYGALATVSKTNWEHLGWYNTFETHEQPNLIAHWPLDGNLNDISGNGYTLTNVGSTNLSNAGKIGLSATLDGTNNYLYYSNYKLPNTTPFTMACWIKTSQVPITEVGIIAFGYYPVTVLRPDGKVRTWWYDGTSYPQVISTNIINDNVWHHITTTYDGTNAKLYVDGVLVNTTASSTVVAHQGLYLGIEHNNGIKLLQGQLNDARFFNKALTADEIKEIAQAKIMHYTFDTCGEPTTNLWQGALSVYNNLGIPATLQTTGEYFKNAPVYRLTMTPNTQAQINSIKANLWNHGVYGSDITYTANTKYHSSIYWKAINKSDIVVDGLASNIGGWASAANYEENGWTRCISYRDGSITENKTGHVFWSFKSPSATLGDSFIIDWCAPQIEQKDHATDYVLTTREGLLIDSSPYHRDAVMTTNYPAWDFTQNVNGRASYRFNYANQDYVALPYFTTDKQAITLSAWMRSNDITKSQNIISRNGPFFLRVTSSTLRVGIYTGTWVFVNGSTTLYSNTWYHLVLTYDGARVKGYVNGVLDIDVAQTGDMLSWTSTIRLGYTTGGEDAPMDGYIDDVRIYATALSQTDIALLYNTQTFITSGTAVRASKNHTIYAHWNPTVASGLLHTMATSALCNIHVEHINILGHVQTASTSLDDAQYENQTVFTITLDRKGGTGGTSTITGSTGINISPTSITPPTWTNYTFTGYWTAASGGTKYINANGTYNNLNSNTFVGTVTLYAQWTMNNVYFDWNPNPATIGLLADISVGGVVQQANSADWYQARAANSTFKVSNLTIPVGWSYSSYGTTNLVNVTTAGSGATTEVQGAGNMAQTSARAIAITVVGNTYNIIVAQNGGTGSSASISTYQPKTTSTSITMTRGTYTNFRFHSWTLSGANGQATVNGNTVTIPVYTTSVKPYGNLTITANWKPATTTAINTTASALGDAQYNAAAPFTITLDKQTGTGGTSSIVCVNGFYLNPTSITAPTRAGYTFGGYFTGTGGTGTQRINSSGTFVGLSNTTYTSAVTLYAKWSTVTYTLTNDRNNGTGGNSSATYNIETSSTLATLLGTVTRAGYTFSAWRWTSSTTGGWTNGTNYAIATNVVGKYASGTLQARWTANSYTVTFNANGGTAPSPASKYVTYASTYGALATTSRTDYILIGWFTAATGGSKIETGTTVTTAGDHTLYAHWKPTVTSGLNTAVTVLGDMQASHEAPTYSITTSSGTGVASMSVSPTTYKTSSVTQNITITRSVSTGFTLNAATITRLGTYGGSTPTVSGTTVSIPASSWGPFRVNQTATRNSFLITLNANGGTTPTNNAISVTYGSSIEAFNVNMLATRTGYTLMGYWTATSGGTQRISTSAYVALTSTTYSSAATLYARWTPNTYAVTFNANGGATASPTSKSVTYDSTYGTLATTSRTGYTFAGWFTASSGGTQVLTTTTVTTSSNHTLYARWTANSFVITLNANGGTTASNSQISVTYNTSIEAFNTNMLPTRNGYTFKGYYTSTSGGTQRISSTGYTALTNTTYSSAATLYTQWESSTPQTSAPSIFDSTGTRDIYTMYRVRNNDASSATIYSDVTTTPPTTSRGVVASGAQTASISTGILKALSGGVIYARAQASGKTMSSITSMYIE